MNPAQAALLEHLQADAASAAEASAPRSYTSIADYVIERGTWEVSGALSREQREYGAAATGGARHERGACFANAQAARSITSASRTARATPSRARASSSCTPGACSTARASWT